MAAATSTIRSLPRVLGLSIRILMPVLMPGPTKSGRTPTIFSTARRMVEFKGGTTEERMAPSMAEG